MMGGRGGRATRMVYRGEFRNGVVVLEDPKGPPGGSNVTVRVLKGAVRRRRRTGRSGEPTLYDRLKGVIGLAEGLPPDLSVNHDHYLYGSPRQDWPAFGGKSMVYRGTVKKGVVVLDTRKCPPEGSAVSVRVLKGKDRRISLYERLRPIIGIARGLPHDLAINHDHYLHGLPRK